ncbi:MAG: hypothetical protein QXQ24_07135, partial [Nitrososphaeria archaeon]
HTSIPEAEKIGAKLLEKLEQWVNIVREKDMKMLAKRVMNIKSKIEKISPEYTKSYQNMYNILENLRNIN